MLGHSEVLKWDLQKGETEECGETPTAMHDQHEENASNIKYAQTKYA